MERITVSLEGNVLDTISEMAKAEDRSKASMIRILLVKALEKEF